MDHVPVVNQPDTAKGSAVGIAVGAGIEVNAQMSPARWEEWLKANPDRTEL